MINIITKSKFYDMLVHAKTNLLASQEHLNALNVFPVPDGDTGSNMSATLKHAVENIKNKDSVKAISAELAKGALMGARGNSGVIMSQIIKGLSLGLDTEDSFTVEEFLNAIHNAKDKAYKAVMKPKEGTMLSIIRALSESAENIKTNDFEECFEILVESADKMLKETQFMLEENKNAGTVDAGACGIVIIFKAFRDCILGIEPLAKIEIPVEKTETVTINNTSINVEDIKFQYCTEFIILKECNEDSLRGELNTIGDSIVVVSCDGITKVHVHTNTPGVALNKAVEIGDVTRIKIENMKEQAENNPSIENTKSVKKERSKLSLLAVCDGIGLEKCFKDSGATHVINGGQSMNPSVESIVDAIENLNSDNVIILPNNKNIILSAKQANDLVDCNVFVVETRSIAEGIVATFAYNELETPEENVKAMSEIAGDVETIHITKAVKDANIDGLSIKEGDYISVIDDHVVATTSTIEDIMNKSLTENLVEDKDIITLYYGDSVSDKIDSLIDILQSKYEEQEIISVYGGQVTYPLIISVE